MNKKSERKPIVEEVFAALDVAKMPHDLFRSKSVRMLQAEIDERGRITLPKAVREHMHIKPGDRIEFILLHVGVLMRRIV